MGLIARSSAEGECLEIARGMAAVLGARYGEVTLVLPPEWRDLRAFIWAGWRQHVRYTYRGRGVDGYEKRLQFHDCFVRRFTTHAERDWRCDRYETGDSVVDALHDAHYAYYWKANEGGHFHADLVNTMIQKADAEGCGFDLVGANGPTISLFKRSFGGQLTPYYAVSTSDVKDLREASYVRAA
jgi:hypothetical protein